MSEVVIDLNKPILALVAISLAAFVVVGFVLFGEVDFGPCLDAVHGRRARLMQHFACSPGLLGGGWREWFVFAWLWSFPAVLLFAVFHRIFRKTFVPE